MEFKILISAKNQKGLMDQLLLELDATNYFKKSATGQRIYIVMLLVIRE